MIRRPPRSTLSSSSAASDVYKRQHNIAPTFGIFNLTGSPLGLKQYSSLHTTNKELVLMLFVCGVGLDIFPVGVGIISLIVSNASHKQNDTGISETPSWVSTLTLVLIGVCLIFFVPLLIHIYTGQTKRSVNATMGIILGVMYSFRDQNGLTNVVTLNIGFLAAFAVSLMFVCYLVLPLTTLELWNLPNNTLLPPRSHQASAITLTAMALALIGMLQSMLLGADRATTSHITVPVGAGRCPEEGEELTMSMAITLLISAIVLLVYQRIKRHSRTYKKKQLFATGGPLVSTPSYRYYLPTGMPRSKADGPYQFNLQTKYHRKYRKTIGVAIVIACTGGVLVQWFVLATDDGWNDVRDQVPEFCLAYDLARNFILFGWSTAIWVAFLLQDSIRTEFFRWHRRQKTVIHQSDELDAVLEALPPREYNPGERAANLQLWKSFLSEQQDSLGALYSWCDKDSEMLQRLTHGCMTAAVWFVPLRDALHELKEKYHRSQQLLESEASMDDTPVKLETVIPMLHHRAFVNPNASEEEARRRTTGETQHTVSIAPFDELSREGSNDGERIPSYEPAGDWRDDQRGIQLGGRNSSPNKLQPHMNRFTDLEV
eukprot:TRINITY_DN4342_c0_g2_i2.p1 TRINITY_DN4342_c0_g2~~TRINITY_DN4342_c0_g2_i2.p1  ORF type:complete len:601 (-),score=113.04 TRINITY_DN4342_c0_g2_i2:13-1815(-)